MTYEVYRDAFEYKAGFLSCHDWRPREYNALADRVCAWVFKKGESIQDLDIVTVSEEIASDSCIQIHSDGGYNGKAGAAGVVIVRFKLKDGEWIPSALGYRGVYIPDARSAFQAELIAAKLAISIAQELGRECWRRRR